MRLIAGLALLAVLVAAFWLWHSGAYSEMAWWAAQKQRAFQTAIAGTVRAIKGGDMAASLGLIGACAAYGLVHAIGPGHGKVLIGGAAVASRTTAGRMAALALVSSLAQALVAIVLVYGGFAIFSMSSRWAVETADQLLAPLSYAVIGLVGVVLLLRGLRALWREGGARGSGQGDRHSHEQNHGHRHHEHHDGHDCGHAHGPSVEQVEKVHSLRDAVALVAVIAMRPCTGAILVLVICWGLGLTVIGAVGVLAMGLGTAAFTMLVAVGGVGLRGAALVATAGDGRLRLAFPAIQIIAGGAVMLAGFGLALPALF